MRKTTIALSALAALRLTRFVTTDTLGSWLILDPAHRWAASHDGAYFEASDGSMQYVHSSNVEHVADDQLLIDADNGGWRSKLVSGLSCPHCVGYWLTAATLLTGAVAERSKTSRTIFNFAAGSLGLSYFVSHISQRLDS